MATIYLFEPISGTLEIHSPADLEIDEDVLQHLYKLPVKQLSLINRGERRWYVRVRESDIPPLLERLTVSGNIDLVIKTPIHSLIIGPKTSVRLALPDLKKLEITLTRDNKVPEVPPALDLLSVIYDLSQEDISEEEITDFIRESEQQLRPLAKEVRVSHIE